jgi:hypothetical protein
MKKVEIKWIGPKTNKSALLPLRGQVNRLNLFHIRREPLLLSEKARGADKEIRLSTILALPKEEGSHITLLNKRIYWFYNIPEAKNYAEQLLDNFIEHLTEEGRENEQVG